MDLLVLRLGGPRVLRWGKFSVIKSSLDSHRLMLITYGTRSTCMASRTVFLASSKYSTKICAYILCFLFIVRLWRWFWAARVQTQKTCRIKGNSKFSPFVSTFFLDSWRSTSQRWTYMDWRTPDLFSHREDSPWCGRSILSALLAIVKEYCVTGSLCYLLACRKSSQRQEWRPTVPNARKCMCLDKNI